MTELPSSVRWQLWIVAFGFFMQSLDTTIVNTALPRWLKALGEPLHMHMVIVSYVLTVAIMLPASGWLADRVGYAISSLAPSFCLRSGRCFVPGGNPRSVGAGPRTARRRRRHDGACRSPDGDENRSARPVYGGDDLCDAPRPVGLLLGPALGGLLVEYASWHWIFLINIPVGIIGAIATLWLMPNYTLQTRRFDMFGFILLALGMATLTLALDGKRAGDIPAAAERAGGHWRGLDSALFMVRPGQRQRPVQPEPVSQPHLLSGSAAALPDASAAVCCPL